MSYPMLFEESKLEAEQETKKKECPYCGMGVDEEGEMLHWWKNGVSTCPIANGEREGDCLECGGYDYRHTQGCVKCE